MDALYQFGRTRYNLESRTFVMGVLNCTPDSFSDGGKFDDPSRALRHAIGMVEDGVDFIDIGGESTRPGADPVPVEEELRRVLPVIRLLARETECPLSIDTYKAEVARQAIEAGASMINDISGFTFDPGIAEVAARAGVPAVLMHTLGRPAVMQDNPRYDNLIDDICASLGRSVEQARAAGVSQIIIDPGIGFGKTVPQNCELIRRLREFKRFGYPVMIGASRKGFIGKILGLPIEDRLEGTMAAVAASVLNGASIVRVHDVRSAVRTARIIDAIVRS
jgi:dihydropteroate synthase